jgi:hypothetical protein
MGHRVSRVAEHALSGDTFATIHTRPVLTIRAAKPEDAVEGCGHARAGTAATVADASVLEVSWISKTAQGSGTRYAQSAPMKSYMPPFLCNQRRIGSVIFRWSDPLG